MKRTRKTKYVWHIMLIFLVGGLTFFYLQRGGIVNFSHLFSLSFAQIALVTGYVLFSFFLLALIEFFIYRTLTPSYTFLQSFVNVLHGNLGSNVTPLKSGHFPLMAYYQARQAVLPAVTVAGFAKCQVLFSATSVVVYGILTVVLAFAGLTVTVAQTTVPLWVVSAIGFSVHALVGTVVLVLTFRRKLQRKILRLFAKIVKLFKKSLDADAFVAEKSCALDRYREQMQLLGQNLPKTLFPASLYAVYMIVAGSVEYVAYLVVSGSPFSAQALFSFYVLHLTCAYVTNVVPVPGGVGACELLFSLVYAAVLQEQTLGAVLVLWRVGSFYVLIALEFAVFLAYALRRRPKENCEVSPLRSTPAQKSGATPLAKPPLLLARSLPEDCTHEACRCLPFSVRPVTATEAAEELTEQSGWEEEQGKEKAGSFSPSHSHAVAETESTEESAQTALACEGNEEGEK